MNTFIITAAGIGKRMGTSLPKQFLLIKGKPILIHTLERFYQTDPTAEIFITLPADWLSYWEELIETHKCEIVHTVVTGGIERYDSIKNAVNLASGKIICVHDGVRPLVSTETIQNCIKMAMDNGSGIPYLTIKESIRKLSVDGSNTVNRMDFITVQTPQCFSEEILKKAYSLPFHSNITDDASLVEEAGFKIHLVEGNPENIKITLPSDLIIAEQFL